jgi:ubiquinone/menaquinone biosynthesis C-methylase UbiE
MGRLLKLVTPLHKQTVRKYINRMTDDKVHCMVKAKEYEFDYWDGDRRYGYGGYRYDGRWKVVAEQLIGIYDLKPNAKILDVCCGKAHLLYELSKLLPESVVAGIDISNHALTDAPVDIRKHLLSQDACESYQWDDDYFDLVISLGSFQNLRIFEIVKALSEIERVGKNKFIMTESYRNEQELFNFECWALTAESFFDTAEWIWIFKHFGYTGDYEFIYCE